MQLLKKHKIVSWLFDEIEKAGDEKENTICYLPIHTISANPYQPRREFKSESLEELVYSIKKYGVLQPVTVRKLPAGNYELVAGERRLRACALAGIRKIPAIVANLNDNDSAVVALVENIQRENLSYMEEAEAYRNLLYKHGLTQEELALALGKSQAFVANKVRLLRLSKIIREIIKDNNLSERHSRAILRLGDEKTQIEALKKITDKKLNVQQTEELVEEILKEKTPKPALVTESGIKPKAVKDVRLFTNTLRHAIELIKRQGADAQSVETEYEDYVEYIITVKKEMKSEHSKNRKTSEITA